MVCARDNDYLSTGCLYDSGGQKINSKYQLHIIESQVPIVWQAFFGCHCIFLFILGPLIKNVNGKATLVGIVSWASNSTCNPEYPLGFVNVAKFTNWIYEKMLDDYMTDLPTL